MADIEMGASGEAGGVGGDAGGVGCEPDGADFVPCATPIENLVFRGGGVKGIAYCGALRVLSDLSLLYNVKRYAGSSAGAISAALLAIGYTITELEELFRNMDLSTFKDSNGNLLARIERLYHKFALYEGNFFYTWISDVIAKKTSNANITFRQVLEYHSKELIIVGACITHMDVVYFSAREHPDMPIRDALRISMSIPILFEPIRIDDHVYVDGGLADNFPLCIFDSETDHKQAQYADINMKTLGMFLQEDKTRKSITRKIDNMKDFVGCLLDTVKMRIAMLSIKPGDEERTLFIQTHHISSTKFGISKEEKDLLYDEGQKAARLFSSRYTPHIVQSTTFGRLIVKLKHGLEIKTHRLACNIHCALTVAGSTRKSSTRLKSSNPIWNETFLFTVKSDTDVLTLEVFDAEVLRSPRSLGLHSIQISEFKNKHSVETSMHIGKGIVLLDVTLSIY